MQEYKRIIQEVIEYGTDKENRTGVRCRSMFGNMIRVDLRKGFPLLTTKFVSLKNVATELEFFIHGLTDRRWLQERGCHIWDEWSSPYNKDSLGPVYGFSWRRFNNPYHDRVSQPVSPSRQSEDQLFYLTDLLLNDQSSRRMIVSAWNPLQLDQMALPPCHILFNCNVTEGRLNLAWYQRSVDVFLGLPYNIASYALLTHILAKHANLEVGTLVGHLADVHIYENHREACNIMLSRDALKLPTIEITNDNIFTWSRDDYILKNYQHHGRLFGKVAV